jgi:hypothetical protein
LTLPVHLVPENRTTDEKIHYRTENQYDEVKSTGLVIKEQGHQKQEHIAASGVLIYKTVASHHQCKEDPEIQLRKQQRGILAIGQPTLYNTPIHQSASFFRCFS